jgi:putative addiction module component (TIGR02574 family)
LRRQPLAAQPWAEEIERRLEEVESGAAKLIPAEEVFAEIRRLLK